MTATTIEDLQKRVEALETGASFDSTQKDVQNLEKEFLAKFQEIREAMLSGDGGGAAAGSSKEIDELKKENEDLKRRNAKLEYRVSHMLKSMEELYSKK